MADLVLLVRLSLLIALGFDGSVTRLAFFLGQVAHVHANVVVIAVMGSHIRHVGHGEGGGGICCLGLGLVDRLHLSRVTYGSFRPL
jgi:hypothetical protein